MAETATATARRRSSLAPRPMDPVDDQSMRTPDGGIRDWFKLRTAFQQFMRENEPLFKALAAVSDDPLKVLGGGAFAEAAETARAIAVAAARQVTGKEAPAAHEIRPFRLPAAMLAASAWQSGDPKSLDTKRLGLEVAAACSIVDEELDKSLFRTASISDEASLNMTALSVTLQLMEPVMTYDFRRDRAELVSAMTTAVMTAVGEAADGVLPANGKADDRRSVVQTLASCLSAVMAQVYERKSKQYLAHVVGMPEAERETFARRYDPMPEILRAFKEAATVYTGAAYAAARSAAEAAGVGKPGEAVPR